MVAYCTYWWPSVPIRQAQGERRRGPETLYIWGLSVNHGGLSSALLSGAQGKWREASAAPISGKATGASAGSAVPDFGAQQQLSGVRDFGSQQRSIVLGVIVLGVLQVYIF